MPEQSSVECLLRVKSDTGKTLPLRSCVHQQASLGCPILSLFLVYFTILSARFIKHHWSVDAIILNLPHGNLTSVSSSRLSIICNAIDDFCFWTCIYHLDECMLVISIIFIHLFMAVIFGAPTMCILDIAGCILLLRAYKCRVCDKQV